MDRRSFLKALGATTALLATPPLLQAMIPPDQRRAGKFVLEWLNDGRWDAILGVRDITMHRDPIHIWDNDKCEMIAFDPSISINGFLPHGEINLFRRAFTQGAVEALRTSMDSCQVIWQKPLITSLEIRHPYNEPSNASLEFDPSGPWKVETL